MVPRDDEAVEVEVKVADDAVVQVLEGGVVEADVVRGPADAEVLRASGKLADEVGEVAVEGVVSGG